MNRLFLLFFSLFFLSCDSQPALDAAKANDRAQVYIQTLFSGKQDLKGPVCMPEEVVNGYTQCSFTYVEAAQTTVGTILCNNAGCMEGDAPKMVAAEMMPTAGGSSGSMNDDWLFWYLLYSNGSTHSYYHSWYDATPSYARTSYYSRSARPSAQATSYYHSNYSSAVRSSATSSYGSKVSAATARTSGYSKSATSSSSSSSSSSKSSSRSSGYGSSKRSGGFSSGGSRRSGS